jgi:hypothetical protein
MFCILPHASRMEMLRAKVQASDRDRMPSCARTAVDALDADVAEYACPSHFPLKQQSHYTLAAKADALFWLRREAG